MDKEITVERSSVVEGDQRRREYASPAPGIMDLRSDSKPVPGSVFQNSKRPFLLPTLDVYKTILAALA